jgi:hypothetical protein
MLARFTVSVASATALLATVVGCGGEGGGEMMGPGGRAARTAVIVQMKSSDSDTAPIPLDVSQLPPDAVQQPPHTNGTGSMVLIKPGYPVKVLVVPANP